jgi:hypothetical protein
MPIYLFQHPKSAKTIEVVQLMSEEHIYIDKDGLKWDRVFTKPQAALDTKIGTHDPREFVNKTKTKNYSIGQMWDMSAELSEKRGGSSGQDEVREKAEKAYEKKTGKKHPHAKKKDSTFFI